jgi:crossover junction endodeoxyribonuclease RusA
MVTLPKDDGRIASSSLVRIPLSNYVTVPTIIELPYPPVELSPNSRTGWRVRTRFLKDYRTDCGWRARAVWGQREPLPVPAEITVTFVVPNSRRRDRDNCISAFKAGQDGLVDAGVIQRDDIFALTVNYRFIKGDSFKVIVSI